MKYYFITSLSLLLSFSVFSQETSYSPFSRFGIGELNSSFFNKQFSMGGANTALYDNFNINHGNPASYSLISEPAFELGLLSNWTRFENSEENVSGNLTRINHVALGLPMNKNKMGLAFGLIPVSRIGYEISSTDSVQDLSVTQQNFGSGGINSLFIGLGRKFNLKVDSVRYGKSKKVNAVYAHSLSLGFNFKYLFGNRINVSRKVFEPGLGFVNTQRSDIDNISDVTLDFGLLASTWLKKKKNQDDSSIRLNFGAQFAPSTKLSTERSFIAESFVTANGVEFNVDSIFSNIDNEGYLDLPSSISLGVSFDLITKKIKTIKNKMDSTFRKKKVNPRKITFALDYKSRSWSDYSENFIEEETFSELVTSQRLSFGMEYMPNMNLSFRGANFQKGDYLRGINYRIGAFNQSGYLNLGDEELSETGINFGVGLPLVKGRRKLISSELSLGVQVSQRGSIESSLIEEQNVMLFFGLRLNPDMSRNPWFVKRKYD